jgi:hypothetical protein
MKYKKNFFGNPSLFFYRFYVINDQLHNNAMHYSEKNFPMEFINKNLIKNYKKLKTSFLAHWASCLETCIAIIPKINYNTYSVPSIIALKFQKNRSTKTKVIAWKQMFLQTDYDRPIT